MINPLRSTANYSNCTDQSESTYLYLLKGKKITLAAMDWSSVSSAGSQEAGEISELALESGEFSKFWWSLNRNLDDVEGFSIATD